MILVTGGAGFIGSWLVERLLNIGQKVIVVDSLSHQIHGADAKIDFPWFANSNLEFIKGDIRDLGLMDRLLAKVESVVHLAAETGTGQSMYQIAHYYDVNQQAVASLFEAVGTRHRNVKKIILASSRSIYGEGAYLCNERIVVPRPRDACDLAAGKFDLRDEMGEPLSVIPTPEYVTPRPASVYAATKLANETLGNIFSDSYGIPIAAMRFQNVYGEGQSLKNPYTGILSIFSNRMRQNLPINIFEDGLESRDFVHVKDVVNSIEAALMVDFKGFKAVNIGSGVQTTVLKVATTLRNILGSSSELNITGDYRLGDIRHCYADIGLAADFLNFKPSVTMEDGLLRFCNWVLTQPIEKDNSLKALKELSQHGLGFVRN